MSRAPSSPNHTQEVVHKNLLLADQLVRMWHLGQVFAEAREHSSVLQARKHLLGHHKHDCRVMGKSKTEAVVPA